MRTILIVSFFILLVSCRTNRSITGVYRNTHPQSTDAIRYTITLIRLKADSTFEFESNVCNGWVNTEKYSSGKWIVNNGYLILNSTYQPHDTLKGIIYGIAEYPVDYRYFTNYAFKINKNSLVDTAENAVGLSVFTRLK